MSEARTHAITASELLRGLMEAEEQEGTMDPIDRLQRAVTGQIRAANESKRYAVDVATAHALTALALALTEAGALAPEPGP